MAAPKSFRKAFFDPKLDKGASKPVFCYPKRKQDLEEEVAKMEKTLDGGNINKEHEMTYRLRHKERKERLDAIHEAEDNAHKNFDQDKDYWVKRREDLKEEIRNTMPTRADIQKRRVNPHKIIKTEKSGFEEKKKEFIVISRLMDEDSNISFLQRDS